MAQEKRLSHDDDERDDNGPPRLKGEKIMLPAVRRQLEIISSSQSPTSKKCLREMSHTPTSTLNRSIDDEDSQPPPLIMSSPIRENSKYSFSISEHLKKARSSANEPTSGGVTSTLARSRFTSVSIDNIFSTSALTSADRPSRPTPTSNITKTYINRHKQEEKSYDMPKIISKSESKAPKKKLEVIDIDNDSESDFVIERRPPISKGTLKKEQVNVDRILHPPEEPEEKESPVSEKTSCVDFNKEAPLYFVTSVQFGSFYLEAFMTVLQIEDNSNFSIRYVKKAKDPTTIIYFSYENIEKVILFDSQELAIIDFIFASESLPQTANFFMSENDCHVLRLTSKCKNSGQEVFLRKFRYFTANKLHQAKQSYHYSPDKNEVIDFASAGGMRPPKKISSLYSSYFPTARITRSKTRSSSQKSYNEDDGTQLSSYDGKNHVSAIPTTDAKPKFLFSYPFGDHTGITITSNELLHLPEGVYFNDSLIDFDLRYSWDHCGQSIRELTHIFSSFFYRKLSNLSSITCSISKVNIFHKQYCFIPINEHLHWFLIIIYNPAGCLSKVSEQSKSSDIESDLDLPSSSEILSSDGNNEQTMIIVFDSLGSRYRKSAIDTIKSFIIFEAKDKYEITVEKASLKATYAKVPLQPNLTDCGCFLLEYAQRFLQDPDVILSHILKLDNIQNWFSCDDPALKRLQLKERIDKLTAEYSSIYPSQPEIEHCSSDLEEITPSLTLPNVEIV